MREHFKLSQRKLAALSELSQGAISLIEDGSRWPELATIAMIGIGLGVSPKIFFVFWATYILSIPEEDWEGVTWLDFLKGKKGKTTLGDEYE